MRLEGDRFALSRMYDTTEGNSDLPHAYVDFIPHAYVIYEFVNNPHRIRMLDHVLTSALESTPHTTPSKLSHRPARPSIPRMLSSLNFMTKRLARKIERLVRSSSARNPPAQVEQEPILASKKSTTSFTSVPVD